MLTELDAIANDFGGPPVPDQDTAEPRFPFVFVFDTSASTAYVAPDGGEPDISKMNSALNLLYQKLKYPPPGDPLALTHHQVDVAVATYSSDVVLTQPWTAAPDLPASAPLLSAAGGTATGKALITALDYVLARQRRYKQQNLPKCGLPHIFHATDGGSNDVRIGGELWLAIQDRLQKLSADPEKQQAVIYHFIAPNGYLPTSGAVDETGQPMTGASVLAKWFGRDRVISLADGADNFSNLVQVLIRTITAVSQQAGEAQDLLKRLNGRSLGDEAHY